MFLYLYENIENVFHSFNTSFYRSATADFTLIWAEKDLQQHGKPTNVAAIANEVNTTLNKVGNGTLELIMLGE